MTNPEGEKMKTAFTEKNMEMIPFAADDTNIIMADILTLLDHKYFIVGRTLSGARFYSEDIEWEDTVDTFKDYKGMVNYFGGGVVELYEYTIDEYELVRSEVCWGNDWD